MRIRHLIFAWKDALSPSEETITRCTQCDKPLVRRPQMFYWRGVYSDGAVCPDNHGLWSIVGEEMKPLRRQMKSTS